MDSIADDVPSQSWSVKGVRGGSAVVVASLLWPGALFFCVPASPQFGQVYFGTGVKNADLAFML